MRRSPRMQRVVLGGPELDGFTVDGPASSIRVLLPQADGTLEMPEWNGNEFVGRDGARALIRTFTPLLVDTERRELAIDVVLHGDGPAARWAADTAIGDAVAISGPGRYDRLDEGATSYLLGGDETAIPAIGQLLEALPATTAVDVRIELARPDARLELPEHPLGRITWLDAEPLAAPGDALVTSVERIDELPPAIWLAGEAAAIQRLRRHLFDVRGLSRAAVTARGYWKHSR
jgi:NADPH-dependent ferric siderophore reductase